MNNASSNAPRHRLHPTPYRSYGIGFWQGNVLPLFKVEPHGKKAVKFRCPRCKNFAYHSPTKDLGRIEHRECNCSIGGGKCWPLGVLLIREVKHND